VTSYDDETKYWRVKYSTDNESEEYDVEDMTSYVIKLILGGVDLTLGLELVRHLDLVWQAAGRCLLRLRDGVAVDGDVVVVRLRVRLRARLRARAPQLAMQC
jgi:hypothetical protein